MPASLEIARRQAAHGQHKKAIETLWTVEAEARGDLVKTEALLDAITELSAPTGGRIRKHWDELLEQVQADRERLQTAERRAASGFRRDAVAVVSRCSVLGGHGLPPRVGEVWELVFTEEAIRLVDLAENETVVPFAEVTAIEIGGPGATRSGGGFIGGGFGVGGAAEGMLIAAALNLLTTRTSIDTVICIQTRTAELFLHHGDATPDSLRIRLSAVFTALRRQVSSQSAPATLAEPHANPVERLAKLADMLDRGLITDEEFRRLKADVLK